ncbi:superinfection immunity protein [Enterobacter mori]|uniref:superinfection immunity protein n=1 Tax=Enterobacter mori TaxID=539813 RepID=UPI0022365795|nr:superinfection immunity protein [Enterobacter mori]MCW4990254.1 superinfection immunity protein [Enterobacter mori]
MKGLDAFTLMDELGIVAAILIFFYLFLEYPFLGFSLYLLPFIISFIRRHRSLTVLSTLNIFAGWFIPVWLVLLTWAIFGEKRITSKTTDTVDTPP